MVVLCGRCCVVVFCGKVLLCGKVLCGRCCVVGVVWWCSVVKCCCVVGVVW